MSVSDIINLRGRIVELEEYIKIITFMLYNLRVKLDLTEMNQLLLQKVMKDLSD